MRTDNEILLELRKKHTNHLLHLLLTILTLGVWGIPWLMIAVRNGSYNTHLVNPKAVTFWDGWKAFMIVVFFASILMIAIEAFNKHQSFFGEIYEN